MAKVREQGQESTPKRGFIISYNSENGYGFVRDAMRIFILRFLYLRKMPYLRLVKR